MKFKVSKEVDAYKPILPDEVRGCAYEVDTSCEVVQSPPQTTSSSILEVAQHCRVVQVCAPSKWPISRDKLDLPATFARSQRAFAEVFSPQILALSQASTVLFEVSPLVHKGRKVILPGISRSAKSSRSFPAKKNEVHVHQICQEKLASGVKFPKPKHEVSSKSMRPWQ